MCNYPPKTYKIFCMFKNIVCIFIYFLAFLYTKIHPVLPNQNNLEFIFIQFLSYLCIRIHPPNQKRPSPLIQKKEPKLQNKKRPKHYIYLSLLSCALISYNDFTKNKKTQLFTIIQNKSLTTTSILLNIALFSKYIAFF